MRSELVEIYSDATNAAIMRHPGRRFPGVLVQGDTLNALCRQADRACSDARIVLDEDAYLELTDLRDHLHQLRAHYRSVMADHGLTLPFVDPP